MPASCGPFPPAAGTSPGHKGHSQGVVPTSYPERCGAGFPIGSPHIASFLYLDEMTLPFLPTPPSSGKGDVQKGHVRTFSRPSPGSLRCLFPRDFVVSRPVICFLLRTVLPVLRSFPVADIFSLPSSFLSPDALLLLVRHRFLCLDLAHLPYFRDPAFSPLMPPKIPFAPFTEEYSLLLRGGRCEGGPCDFFSLSSPPRLFRVSIDRP